MRWAGRYRCNLKAHLIRACRTKVLQFRAMVRRKVGLLRFAWHVRASHWILISLHFTVGAGDLPDGVHCDRNPPVLGLGLDPIKIRPNFLQTLYAMLRLRILRLFRNIQLFYFTIVAPLFLIVLGLHLNSIQTAEVKMQSLKLDTGNLYSPRCLMCLFSFLRTVYVLFSYVF